MALLEPACLELLGGIGGAFNNRHSSFTCKGDKKKKKKTVMALKCEYYNYIIRGVNRYRFLETDYKFINKALKT